MSEKTKRKAVGSERPTRAPRDDDHDHASPAEIASDIAQTRAEMSETIAAIERRLDPSDLRAKAIEELEVVEEKVKEVVREQIAETKASVKAELREAKEAIKEEAREAFTEAKQALHDATIGKAKTMAKQASDTMIETGDTFVDTVKRNPIPAAMVGIGLAWLFLNRSRGDARRIAYRELDRGRERSHYLDSQGRPYDPSYDLSRGGVAESLSQAKDSAGRLIHRAQETASHAAHDVRDAAGNLAHQIGDTAGNAVDQVKSTATGALDTVKTTATDLAHRASDQATHLKEYAGERAHFVADKGREGYHFVADKGREGYHFAEDKFDTTLEENPLALGAVALAIGAAIGLAIPKTERENRVFGPYREQLFDTARAYAHDAVGQLHVYGEQAGEQVKGQLGQAMKPS